MTTPGSPSPDQQPSGQNPYGQQPQNPYGQPQYGQPQYGQPQQGQPQHGQNPYAQQPPQNNPYGQPQQGQHQQGQPQNPYAQNQYGQNPYAPPAQPAGYYSPAEGDPGSLDLPWYGIGMGDAVKRVFQKYAHFDGRASRGEFWWFSLGNFLIVAVLYIIILIGLPSAANSTSVSPLVIIGAILLFVYSLAVIVPSIAVSVRRLHDGGYSGWLYLIGFVPFVGGIALIVLLAMPSKPEGAQYDKVTARPAGY